MLNVKYFHLVQIYELVGRFNPTNSHRTYLKSRYLCIEVKHNTDLHTL